MSPVTIALGVVALLLLVFIIENVIVSKAYIWIFGPYITISTGWLVLISVLIGMGMGWAIARGRTPKR